MQSGMQRCISFTKHYLKTMSLYIIEKILEKEYSYAEKFYSKIGKNVKIDPEFYEVLIPFFNDTTFIEKLICSINEILLWEKNSVDSELVLTDFLFGFLEHKKIDDCMFQEYVISRYHYIKYIETRAKINTILGIEYSKYINTHKRLLIALRLNNVIERKIIKTLNEGKHVSHILIKLKFVHEVVINTKFLLPQNQFTIHYITENDKISISNFRTITEIYRKKKEIEYKNISLYGIEKSNSIPLNINSQLLLLNKNIIDDYINENFKIIGCNTIPEYFARVKQIFTDLKYGKMWFKTNNNLCENTTWENLLEDLHTETSSVMKIFQEVNMLIYIRQVCDISFYISSFIDGRGRQYYDKWCSPTFYKTLRFLISFGIEIELNEREIKNSIYYKKIIKYKKHIEHYKKNDLISYILIILFIEAGKFFIKELPEIEISVEQIITSGINAHNNKLMCKDRHDNMYLNKIYCNISNILKDNAYDKNTIIFKDATASGLQNLGIIFGYKEETLPILNLSGDNWTDTYKYLIKKYWNHSEFAGRDEHKGGLMTIPYNASWRTCFMYFINKLNKKGINYYNLSKEKQEEIKNIHIKFYWTIKKNIINDLYKNNTNNSLEFQYHNYEISKINEYKINYKKNRDKYTEIEYKKIRDKKTEKRANTANNMHYLDAKLVRYVFSNVDVISIHDCFGVRLCEVHKLMDCVNNYYSQPLGNKGKYSMFILL